MEKKEPPPEETGSNRALPHIRDLVKKFVPWDGYLAIRPIYEGRTASGIIIPDTAKENAQVFVCDVFAVGPGCRRTKAGDTVLVHGKSPIKKVKWATISEEQDFFMIREDGILGSLGELPEGYKADTLADSLAAALKLDEPVAVQQAAPTVQVQPRVPGGFHS
jgi:co-chaperonin GroES (HSP10)